MSTAAAVNESREVSAAEAARIIRCTKQRICQLIADKKLKARRVFGRMWAVTRRSCEAYRDAKIELCGRAWLKPDRGPGRPPHK